MRENFNFGSIDTQDSKKDGEYEIKELDPDQEGGDIGVASVFARSGKIFVSREKPISRPKIESEDKFSEIFKGEVAPRIVKKNFGGQDVSSRDNRKTWSTSKTQRNSRDKIRELSGKI